MGMGGELHSATSDHRVGFPENVPRDAGRKRGPPHCSHGPESVRNVARCVYFRISTSVCGGWERGTLKALRNLEEKCPRFPKHLITKLFEKFNIQNSMDKLFQAKKLLKISPEPTLGSRNW